MPFPALIPAPVTVVPSSAVFTLQTNTVLVANGDAEAVGVYAQSVLAPATGFRLPRTNRAGANAIFLRLVPRQRALGAEGYTLDVRADRIEIVAAAPAGLFYGVQTLRQLMPINVYRRAPLPGQTWTVPGVHIEDQPRFAWRGAMVDVARHFMPKESLFKFVDLLAMHKLNRLHLHLTDDQGWRIEIKQYPRLTSVGAWRKESMEGHYEEHRFDGKPHGGFYTQEDLRELVAYASTRFVTIVPEIEMPGHSHAAIAAYPELGNVATPLEVSTQWGVDENIYNVNDGTIKFLENVLTEVIDIFPSPFIHIGGDEVPKTQWQKSPEAQARMKSLGLADEHELQSWVTRHMDAWLTAHGRRLVGWDEILEGGLAPGATVMSWRGISGGIAAAKSGHDVVMAPTDFTYFDAYQSPDRTTEPLAIGGYISVEKAYRFDPVPAELTPDQARHILGAQGQLWTEYIPDSRQLEYMAFPRQCALAEVVWTPQAQRNFSDFHIRLDGHLPRLRILDVNFRRETASEHKSLSARRARIKLRN